MKIDIDAIFVALERAQSAFALVEDLTDAAAAVLAESGQPELQTRLAALRADNDAARERRRLKLDQAARA